MPQFKCSGEFGDEVVEAEDIDDAALSCAENHAGLDCDEVCTEPWTFTVDDCEFRVDYLSKHTIIVYDWDDREVGTISN